MTSEFDNLVSRIVTVANKVLSGDISDISENDYDLISDAVPMFLHANSNPERQQHLQRNMGIPHCVALLIVSTREDFDFRQNVCRLIELFLQSASFSDVLVAFQDSLADGLTFKGDARVRLMCLGQLEKMSSSDSTLLKSCPIWPDTLVSILADEDLRVYEAAQKLFVRVR
jgi:hypothetical protein